MMGYMVTEAIRTGYVHLTINLKDLESEVVRIWFCCFDSWFVVIFQRNWILPIAGRDSINYVELLYIDIFLKKCVVQYHL